MSTRKLRISVFTLSLGGAAYFGWRSDFMSGGFAIALGIVIPLLFFWAEMHQKRLTRKMWERR